MPFHDPIPYGNREGFDKFLASLNIYDSYFFHVRKISENKVKKLTGGLGMAGAGFVNLFSSLFPIVEL